MSKTVFSPAKEPIEVFTDDEWRELTDMTAQGLRQWQPARRPILAALWNHGTFTNASGQVTASWFETAKEYGLETKTAGNMNGVIRALPDATIDRVMRGKRTYRATLVALPEAWYNRLNREWPTNGHKAKAIPLAETPEAPEEPPEEPTPEAPAEPTPEDREAANLMESIIMPEAEPMPEPVIDLQIAQSVATALLTQVVEIVSTGNRDTATLTRLKSEHADMSHRLAKALEEGERQRRNIRAHADEIIALRTERDGLRQRIRVTEANLEKALHADTASFVRERVNQELAQIMTAKPHPKPLASDE